MGADPPIRVTVIGGYLGAGKTTLVNHVLANADERIAVIVNDFGDVNIDAALIESTDGDTISLANGCICCSVVDGFTVALDTIRASTPRPERLVIEASGVAIPSQVAAHAYGPGTVLDGIVTVVDAETIRRNARSEYVGDVVTQQLAATDLVVLNKIDLVDASARNAAEKWLASATDAPVVSATHGAVGLDVLLGLDSLTVVPADVVDGSAGFATSTLTWDDPVDRSELDAAIDGFSPAVVRAKGIVRLTEQPDIETIVHIVGQRISITEGSPWARQRSELVVIEVTR